MTLSAKFPSRLIVFLLCGYGLAEEAAELVANLRSAVRVPMIGVLGNHDFESGQPELVQKVLENAGVTMLDGEAIEMAASVLPASADSAAASGDEC